jgi:hypothetical protein
MHTWVIVEYTSPERVQNAIVSAMETVYRVLYKASPKEPLKRLVF